MPSHTVCALWVAAFQPILEKTWKGGATVLESKWAKGLGRVKTVPQGIRWL